MYKVNRSGLVRHDAQGLRAVHNRIKSNGVAPPLLSVTYFILYVPNTRLV